MYRNKLKPEHRQNAREIFTADNVPPVGGLSDTDVQGKGYTYKKEENVKDLIFNRAKIMEH